MQVLKYHAPQMVKNLLPALKPALLKPPSLTPHVSTSTTFTCDQYVHHVVLDTFLNAYYLTSKDLREWNPRRSHHHKFCAGTEFSALALNDSVPAQNDSALAQNALAVILNLPQIKNYYYQEYITTKIVSLFTM